MGAALRKEQIFMTCFIGRGIRFTGKDFKLESKKGIFIIINNFKLYIK